MTILLATETKHPPAQPPLGFPLDDDDTGFTNGALFAAPITIAAERALNGIAVKYQLGTSGYVFGVGIYSDDAGEPGTLIVGNNEDFTVTGWNTVSIASKNLSAGTYWLVTVSDYYADRTR